ncbi:hypothetical protein GETHLI_28550 [Geothrix limicola]|uniref:histidine kinase n=1 Tax=Geothrix limicola TaxID=2927978 RepID=A0ABQ5QJ49_9BACT|nr:PAS domain S-box protein [Geothrix limicola]GLH74353.1 hypothetical protein GETHLI_28550 [Geothrix limicola]
MSWIGRHLQPLLRLGPRSFRHRLLAGMLLSIGSVMLVFISHAVFTQRRDLLQQSEVNARSLARTLAVSAISETLERDVQGMRELLDSVSQVPELRYAMILSLDGRILAHTERSRAGEFVVDDAGRRWLASSRQTATLARTDRLIDVAAPILAEGRPVGWVRVGLGQEAVAASLRTLMRDGALFTLLALGLGALASHLISRRLARGLERLVSLAREADPETKPAPPAAPGLDELGELGQAFDRLTQELDLRVRDLCLQERFLHDMMEHLPVIALVHGADGTVEFGNPAARGLFGLAPKQILGKSFPELTGPLFREDGQLIPVEDQPLACVLRQRAAIHGSMIGFRRGGVDPMRWFLLNAFPELDAAGGVHRILVAMIDISERQQAKNQLRKALDELEDLYQNAPCGYHSLGPDGTILRINDTELRWLGYAREELVGKVVFLDLIAPSSRHVFQENFAAFKARGWVNDLEFDMQRKDGTLFSVLLSATAINAPDGTYLYSRSSLTDVTERTKAEQERRRLETEVHHFQRLDSLGNLAGGVAHDMNNILAVILNLVELQSARLAEDAPERRECETIKKACTHGAELVRRLTQFARKQMEQPEPLDLNALVRDEKDTLERTTLKKAEWVLDLEDPLPTVMGQASEIGNAIINICINALDAMPRGGRITLRTRALATGGVRLSIEDNGTGMAPEVLARALDPFFTTKPVGKGTGLGLATVYGTIKAHGGTVDLQSQVGVGTTVHLSFPPVRGEAGEVHAAADGAEALPPIRVLLVDDNDLLRLTVPALLEGLGLTVEAVEGGLQALERLGSDPPVDLVILDQNMPGLTGTETLRRLRITHPDLPVLLSSGYQGEDAGTAVPLARVGVLEKPYTLAALRRAIAALTASTKTTAST